MSDHTPATQVMIDPEQLTFNDQGLMPAIVQDAMTREILMLGYMNAEALQKTEASGDVWFYSRSRQILWHKGETSGNVLRVVSLHVDCDADTLLVLANPAGPTCHTGAVSCFGETGIARTSAGGESILAELAEIISQRYVERPEGSYTTYLFNKGLDKICKKIGEEAAEVIIAAKNGSAAEISLEMADLFYHALVLLQQSGVSIDQVWDELRGREGQTPRPLPKR